jgi:hypothetical protein
MVTFNHGMGGILNPVGVPTGNIYTPSTYISGSGAIDLSTYLPPARDQGLTPMCIAFSVSGQVGHELKKHGLYIEPISENWIYNGGRAKSGYFNSSFYGMWDYMAYDWLNSFGILLEHYWPIPQPPPLNYYDNTNPYQSNLFKYTINYPFGLVTIPENQGVNGIISAINDGHAVSICTPWFWDWALNPTAGPGQSLRTDYILPSLSSAGMGYHGTVLYGYDMGQQLFMGRNSWGTNWALGGNYRMPFSAFNMFKTYQALSGSRTSYDAQFFKLVNPPSELQYTGYLATDGVHIKITNYGYDQTPNPLINNAAPANRLWVGAGATVYFPYFYYGSYWIYPGNNNVGITNIGTNEGVYGVGPYPYGIPIPAIGQSTTVVLPYELFRNATVYQFTPTFVIEPMGTSAAEPGYPGDVKSAVLSASYTWNLGGNLTKKPTDNLPITITRTATF